MGLRVHIVMNDGKLTAPARAGHAKDDDYEN
jgi:hypothetical protein